jgi:predicted DNA-binding transcriptional regulator AlpA
MEEFLTVQELSKRIKYAKQSIYNFINKGTFIQGKHYIKPSRKKILFIWSAVNEWLNDSDKEIQEINNNTSQEISAVSIPNQQNPQSENNFNI